MRERILDQWEASYWIPNVVLKERMLKVHPLRMKEEKR